MHVPESFIRNNNKFAWFTESKLILWYFVSKFPFLEVFLKLWFQKWSNRQKMRARFLKIITIFTNHLLYCLHLALKFLQKTFSWIQIAVKQVYHYIPNTHIVSLISVSQNFLLPFSFSRSYIMDMLLLFLRGSTTKNVIFIVSNAIRL